MVFGNLGRDSALEACMGVDSLEDAETPEEPERPDADTLAKIAETYGFDTRSVRVSRLGRGCTAFDLFSLETGQGPFILKRYSAEASKAPKVTLGHQVLDFLRDNGFRHAAVTRRISKRADGVQYLDGHDSLIAIDGTLYSVQEHIEGSRTARNKDIETIAYIVAQYHKAVRPFQLERDFDFLKTWRETIGPYLRRLGSKVKLTPNEERTKAILDSVTKRTYLMAARVESDLNLDAIVCHRDLCPGNILIDSRGKRGHLGYLTGFDRAWTDYRFSEFAWVIATTLLREGAREILDESAFQKFVRTYQRVNPLSREELELVPDMLEIFANKFVRSYIIYAQKNGMDIGSKEASQKLGQIENYLTVIRLNKRRIRKMLLHPEDKKMSREQMFRPVIEMPTDGYCLGEALTEEHRRMFDSYVNGTAQQNRALSALFNDIRLNRVRPHNYPEARIDANGSLELADQRSRDIVAAAGYLGFGTLPVSIRERDPEWKYFVRRMGNRENKLYQQLEHPEFDHWAFKRDDERLKMLEPYVGGLEGKKVFDVGSNLGYVSRWFARRGAHVQGLDRREHYCKASARLNDVEGTDVVYHNEDLIKWLKEHPDETFDQIVCLSIIHNIAQQGYRAAKKANDPAIARRAVDNAKWALRDLSRRAPVMYFDIGQANEGKAVKRTGLDLHKDNLEKFIRENSEYTKVTLIGTEHGYCGRNLYRLER